MAAPVQVALLNAGLVLLAGTGAGWVGPGYGRVGAVLAFVGGGIALAKAWLFAAAAGLRKPTGARRLG